MKARVLFCTALLGLFACSEEKKPLELCYIRYSPHRQFFDTTRLDSFQIKIDTSRFVFIDERVFGDKMTRKKTLIRKYAENCEVKDGTSAAFWNPEVGFFYIVYPVWRSFSVLTKIGRAHV